jgi:hypothetical protein
VDVRKQTIGREGAPLLVIDDFAETADTLVRQAVPKNFVVGGQFFPGIRARAPLTYQRFLLGELGDLVRDFFELEANALRLSMCHYSLVTAPPEKLVMEQRIPHTDSAGRDGLATIHYLFRAQHGGTAFYRHRKTGFEYIDESRKADYLSALEQEVRGPDAPRPAYINGDTPLFEQIAKEEGVFNRLLVYRRNSLHSGSIDQGFVPDPNPLMGRLSINSFIDAAP